MDKNARIAWTLVLVTAGMLGLAYAAVPLYQAFCRATGFAGTPLVAQSDSQGAGRPVIARTVKVRFDTNVDPGLSWRFEPVQREVTVHLGEEKLVYFHATNISQRPIVGAANYNVTPERTAGWFNKVQCFCFTEQLLIPGQSVDMPVIFFVDPDMAKDRAYDDINTITLSYTFHEAKTPRAKELLRGASANESGKGS